ncbi:MAG: low molecular weight phosphatase family protein, partial [Rhodospirillaceae bacterium]
LALLAQMKFPAAGMRSKSWDEFAKPGAPVMDYVFTVCDQAKGETCPIWPGHPITAHWGVADPAAATGTAAERMLAFREAFRVLESRIRYFLTFRFKEMRRDELQAKVDEVGKMTP